MSGPIMVVHNRYRQRAGEDAEVDAEISNLAAHGHDVFPVIVDNAAIDESSAAAKVRLAVETVWSGRAARTLTKKLEAVRPAVIHVHNTFPLFSPAIYAALDRSGAAVVQSVHNYRLVCPSANLFRDGQDCTACIGQPVAWPGVVHACYHESHGQSLIVASMLAVGRANRAWDRAVDRYIAPSANVAETLGGRVLPKDRMVVVPNFVDPDPGPGDPGDRPATFIFAGRLAPEKGVMTIPAAWALLDDGSATCRIAGDGPLADVVGAAASRDPRVIPLGSLERSALDDAIRRARALIFPSIWREPFGLSVIEAFASGTPVIAAHTGAPADLVEDGVTGLMFQPGDASHLADRIRWALAHPAEMASMGRQARREYEQRYTAEAHYQGLMDVYEAALSHRRGRHGEANRSGAMHG